MDKKIFIYDLETLDIFTATFLDRYSDELRVFILSKTKNNISELFEFLNNEVKGLIGFNCLTFDSQILEYLYRNPECTAKEIQIYSQIITKDNDRYSDVSEWKLRIPHLDLYKIHHFDNKNRRTGLKWCEYMMDLDNIEDMPSQGEGDNWEEMVLSYNLNDVIATKELYIRTKDMIELRRFLSSKYNLNLYNASNSKIGSEILLKLYCDKTHKLPKDIRSKRTYRQEIIIKDIIFPYIKFKSVEFNILLNSFNQSIVKNTKEGLDYSIEYKGFTFDYGSGGIHGSIKNKQILSDDNYIIIDADVASLYPSIACVNHMYPQHLGKEFYEVYKHDIVDVRLGEKAKGKEGNKHIIDGYKEAANASYGKSNDMYSWMYDPQYTLQTTVNGQLMLTMLAESLFEIPEIQVIQINTDGITIKIPRTQLDNYYKKCKEWENITNLQLEFAEYSKMIIFDVNNYIALYTNGKHKCKGKCEFENIPLHKNKSHNIIPIAVFEYFINNKPIEETIKNHKNIFDFCAGVKAKWSKERGQSHYELHSIVDGKLFKQKLSKTVRYFISNKGQYLIKCYESGNDEYVEAPKKNGSFRKDWKVTYFNKKYTPNTFEEYNIDYSYYIIKAKELITTIEDKLQLELF